MTEHPNYPDSYSLKTLICIFIFVSDFNMVVPESDFQNFSLSDFISVFEINVEYPTIFVSAKKK